MNKAFLVKLMPKGALVRHVQKVFSKRAGLKIIKADIFIDYPQGVFNLIIYGEGNYKNSRKGLVSEYSDISEILLEKVKGKIKAQSINLIDLKIDFETTKFGTDVYYTSEAGERETFFIDNLF